jgi:hypothetical protein
MGTIAILGGTGSEGIGLAMRFAAIGEEIVIGSRDPARARDAAARVVSKVPAGSVAGAANAEAASRADMIVLAFPHAGVEPFVGANAAALAGKVVVDVIVPLRVEDGVFLAAPVAAGSVGEQVARLAPRARVVSAFKNLSAERLLMVDEPLDGDILVCGDDVEAKESVCALTNRVRNLRAVDAGPLSGAAALERLTVLLLNVNRRYRAVTSIRVVGI